MFSVLVYLILNFILEMPFWVLVFILLSTIFVDIDAKNSRFGKMWIFRPVQWITNHRGIFHSLFAAILLSCFIGVINLWAGFGFFVGYISHLFLDCFTKSGVMLFWPLKFKIRGIIKSGNLIEDVIFVLLLLGDVFIVGKMMWNIFF
jgi:inner membrane protein